MKKIIIIIVLLITITVNGLKSQTTVIDTLQWLKSNIEADSNIFKGKTLNTLLDSLKGYKKAIVEYSGARMPGLGLNKVDTIWVDQIDLYFEPFFFSYKTELHLSFVPTINNPIDTINTHIKYLSVYFKKPVPFLTRWWSYNMQYLGTTKWNKSLELLYGNAIVENISVEEY